MQFVLLAAVWWLSDPAATTGALPSLRQVATHAEAARRRSGPRTVTATATQCGQLFGDAPVSDRAGLPVRDIAAAAAFYRDRLGFSVGYADDGRARVVRDDAEVRSRGGRLTLATAA